MSIANGNEATIIRKSAAPNELAPNSVVDDIWLIHCDCGADFTGENVLIAFGLWLGHDATAHR